MQICIKNFKGYRDSGWFKLNPLTLVYGQNGVGKSAIIESILLSEQIFNLLLGITKPRFNAAANATLDIRFDDTYLDLGDFETCVYGKDTSSDIQLAYRLNAPLIGEGVHSKVEVHVDIQSPGDVGRINFVLHEIKPSEFLALATSEFPFLYELPDGIGDEIENDEPVSKIVINLVRIDESAWSLTTSSEKVLEYFPKELQEYFEPPESEKFDYQLRIGEGPFDTNITVRTGKKSAVKKGYSQRPLEFDDEKKHFPTLFGAIVHRIIKYLHQNFFSSPAHLPAYRGNPRRVFDVVKGTPDPVQWSAVLLSTDSFRKRQVIEALKNLGVYEGDLKTTSRKDLGATQIRTFFQKQLPEADKAIKLTLSDLGFGVSQVLPLLVAMADTKRSKFLNRCRLFCIEEPESHLHPALQGNLIELLAEQSLANLEVYSAYEDLKDHNYARDLVKKHPSKMKRYVVETHSENFLKRLQKLIRNGVISNEAVSILFCSNDEELGPIVTDLGVDSDGGLMNPWPNDYLEQD